MMPRNGFWILDASGFAFQASPDKRYWLARASCQGEAWKRSLELGKRSLVEKWQMM